MLVRDMKNPGEKIGNDVWCDLPPQALQIILSMPKVAAEIFPYSTDAICSGFTRACQFLLIEDLHFHDLRHDGVSHLFEIGWNIPRVAATSGHRSWKSLARYTHLRQTGDKYAGWKWLSVATEPLAPRSHARKRHRHRRGDIGKSRQPGSHGSHTRHESPPVIAAPRNPATVTAPDVRLRKARPMETPAE